MTHLANRQDLAGDRMREGLQRLREGAFRAAQEAFQAAVALTPRAAETHFYLGCAFQNQNDDAAAERAFREALDLDANSGPAAHLLGALLSHQEDRLDEAMMWLQRAVDLLPQDAQPRRNLGVLQLFLGQIEEGRENLLSAAEMASDLGEAMSTLAGLMAKAPPQDQARFDALIARQKALGASLPLPRHVETLFAMGAVLESRGDYDGAFAALEEANTLYRSTLTYSTAKVQDFFARIRKIFTRERIASLAPHGHPSKRPIFVMGMPRSGTTLVEQILCAHPQVLGAGETMRMIKVIGGTTGRNGSRYPDWVDELNGADQLTIARAYLEGIPQGLPHQTRFTDKRLENFEFIGLIASILPNATFVRVRRDPRDAGFSCYAMRFAGGQAWAYSLKEIGEFQHIFEEMMAHWKAVLPPGRILEVDYEDLVADQEGETRRILEHCDLPFDPACLNYQDAKRAVRSASFAQVRQPIYDRSIGRWKSFEAHLGPMISEMDLSVIPAEPREPPVRLRSGAGMRGQARKG